MDYSIKIGGEAGHGIQTIGNTLVRAFSRVGYHVFAHQDYESRIRGGHNFFQIRFSEKPVMTSKEKIDIVVALDKASIPLHEKELSENGQMVYDSSAAGKVQTLSSELSTHSYLDIPFVELAIKHGGDKIMANTAAVGAVLGMLGMEKDILLGIIKDTFKKKGEELVKANMDVAIAGHDYAVKAC